MVPGLVPWLMLALVPAPTVGNDQYGQGRQQRDHDHADQDRNNAETAGGGVRSARWSGPRAEREGDLRAERLLGQPAMTCSFIS
jgi:hypothetical protein